MLGTSDKTTLTTRSQELRALPFAGIEGHGYHRPDDDLAAANKLIVC